MKRVAVITGATRGIGLAAARLFLEKGFAVYGIARKPYSGDDFYCYPCNICDYNAIDAVFKDVYEREGRIDVLVNNAGFGIAGAVEEASSERIKEICEVNLAAQCVLCGKVIPYMKETGGRIINVSSVGGIMPLPYQALYSATKAGLEVFSRALANEVKNYNIKVCAVLPGDTRTGFTEARIKEGGNERARKSINKMERDERRGKPPESVANAIYKAVKRKNTPLRVTVGGVSKLEVFISRLLPLKILNFILYKMYG